MRLLKILLITLISTQINSQDLTRLNNSIEYKSGMAIQGLYFEIEDPKNNSELSEIGCDVYKNKLILISNKERGFSKTYLNPSTNIPNHNVFCTDVLEHNNLGIPLMFSKILNSKMNQGGITFTPDEKTIYFTRTKTSESNLYSLYVGKLDISEKYYWSDIRPLKLNNEDYSIESPHIGNTPSVIYFSSNKPGGYGGFDLYKGTIDENGEIINVVNLGNQINTFGDEKYPYLDEYERYLYFSSNGHNGYGGYDLFKSSIIEKEFSVSKNLGNTINTPTNDLAFIFNQPTIGYVASNEIDTPNDYNIYKFKQIGIDQKVVVSVKAMETKLPIVDASIVVKNQFKDVLITSKADSEANTSFTADLLDDYKIEVNHDDYILQQKSISINDNNDGTNLHRVDFELKKYPFIGTVVDYDSKLPIEKAIIFLIDGNDKILLSTESKANGKFRFTELPEKNFKVKILKKDYHSDVAEYDRPTLEQNQVINEKFELIRSVDRIVAHGIVLSQHSDISYSIKYKDVNYENARLKIIGNKIEIENICFDFDKYTIKEESFLTLNKIYDLLIDKPEINITLFGHTDNHGTDEYNLELSKNRLYAAYNYLVSKGIVESRLSYKWFGESMPKIMCGTKCTPEQDAINRRVEFFVD